MIRTFRIAMGLALLAAALSPVAAAQATASQVVQTSSEDILTQIQQRRDEFKADEDALHRFVREQMNKVLDQGYTARLVLGLHARSATPEQIDAFGTALSDNLTRRYARALLEVDGSTKVKVLGETALRGGKIIRAKTEISRSAGAPIAVDYLMRDLNGEWRAFDVIVEGISYVQTFRSQFDPLIREKGLAQVTTDLSEGRIEANPDANTQSSN